MCDYGAYDLVEYATVNELKIQGNAFFISFVLSSAVNVFTVESSALGLLRWEGTESGHSLKRFD